MLREVSVSLSIKFAAMRRMLGSSDNVPWYVPYDSVADVVNRYSSVF